MDNVFSVDPGAHSRCMDLKPCRIHLKADMLHLKASGYRPNTQSVMELVDAGLEEHREEIDEED